MPVSMKSITPRRLFKMNGPAFVSASRANMRLYLKTVAIQMRKYPPQQGNSNYVRTGLLKEGWSDASIQVNADGSEGTLINPVEYAGFVQGPRRHGERTEESGSHQSDRNRKLGWESITDVARRTRPYFENLMNRSIKAGIEE